VSVEAPWATGISTVTLFVDDLLATKRFYVEAFGVPLIYEDDNSAVFRFGVTQVNLLETHAADDLIEPAAVGGAGIDPRMAMTITVDDVDAVAEELRSRGVELLNGPMDRPWGVRTAAFRDPAGHVWEIAQPIEEENR
jgi:catechol 2,3-dioxygenase-like lactoylglutathione lyase family enzyme